MIAADLVSALSERGQTVAVAESLTGGLVCATLVDVPGASAVVRGAVVAYATELKHRLLDVDGDLLARNGPVDPLVAEQMALGVRERLGADWGLSTTGVAGPDPQDGAPPGRVYIALAGPFPDVPAGESPSQEPVPGSAPAARAPSPDVAPALEPVPGGAIGSRVLMLDLPGDRAAVRRATTERVLAALLSALGPPPRAAAAEPSRPL
jgi:nicotinamide-nucleotide amidase